ncbi:MAG: ABC transporter permease [Nitrospirae bacterium]|nr:ABC transporter permease [Nitrospirota bacterium]
MKQTNLSLLMGLGIIITATLVALFAPWIAPYPYDLQDMTAILQPPGMDHLLGTDGLGRDLLSRIIFGARVSLSIGLFTSLVSLAVGTLYGAIAGYKGGWADHFMMRIVDVLYAVPDLLLIILITVVIGRGFWGIFLALSLVSWVSVARLVRGEALKIKEMPYVEAAVAAGAGNRRILFRHILPGLRGLLIITMTFRIPAAILSESTLSFVGVGLAPPFSSWGVLANDGWTAMRFFPHLMVFPGVAIFVIVLACNVVGDALRDLMETKPRI